MPETKLSDSYWNMAILPFKNGDEKLTKLDNALKRYRASSSGSRENPYLHDNNIGNLAGALTAWELEKDRWKSAADDPRKTGEYRRSINTLLSAIELLEKELDEAEKERQTLSALQNEPQRIVKDLFYNRRLVSSDEHLGKLKTYRWTLKFPPAVKSVSTLAKAITPAQASPSKSLAKRFLTAAGAIESDIEQEVMGELEKLLPRIIDNVVVSLVPFASLIKEGGNTLMDLAKTIEGEIGLQKAREHRHKVPASGTPEAAIDAMIEVMKDEEKEKIFSASLGLANCCVELATLVAPAVDFAGKVYKAASSLFELGNVARIVARDVRQKNAANKLMSKQELDIKDAFETCPMLGAYYVWCVPTSVLVNRIFDSWSGGRGSLGQETETAIKDHVYPLKEEARRQIKDHPRFVIKGIPGMPDVQKQLEAQSSRAAVGR